ncbi:homoserine O-acetyltransferase [Candidatus Margulisiibacteriota bacterium]
MSAKSLGIVKTQVLKINVPLVLESGERLHKWQLAYETYGKLNADRSNAILVCHALSGDAHVAGKNSKSDKKPGWWDIMVGPGKAYDTNKYFVICSNIIGGCKGSTGPVSINPKDGKEYGLRFPSITVRDMVNAQKVLIDKLGIKKLYNVVGGSLGGMQVLDWTIAYPEKVASAIVLASTWRLSPQAIAFNEVGRKAIMSDPNWNNGNYYGKKKPAQGLSIARMVGHITYLSDESMHKKFGRELREQKNKDKFGIQFQVESYLHYQGESFVERFDANSYLYITRAADNYDLSGGYKSLEETLKNTKAKYLIVTFSSDWLFPQYQSLEIVRALKVNGRNVSYRHIESSYGHDAFLLEDKEVSVVINAFLKNIEDNIDEQ